MSTSAATTAPARVAGERDDAAAGGGLDDELVRRCRGRRGPRPTPGSECRCRSSRRRRRRRSAGVIVQSTPRGRIAGADRDEPVGADAAVAVAEARRRSRARAGACRRRARAGRGSRCRWRAAWRDGAWSCGFGRDGRGVSASGRSVTARIDATSGPTEVESESRSPVTPVRETRYTNPVEYSATSSSRSRVLVGAARKTVSSPCRCIDLHIVPRFFHAGVGEQTAVDAGRRGIRAPASPGRSASPDSNR